MNNDNTHVEATTASSPAPGVWQRLGEWMQDPMGSVIAASAATIGSFGIVLSGTWLISLAVSS